jgi:hypothetical protein
LNFDFSPAKLAESTALSECWKYEAHDTSIHFGGLNTRGLPPASHFAELG